MFLIALAAQGLPSLIAPVCPRKGVPVLRDLPSEDRELAPMIFHD
jgi:hypothetical protein